MDIKFDEGIKSNKDDYNNWLRWQQYRNALLKTLDSETDIRLKRTNSRTFGKILDKSWDNNRQTFIYRL